MGRVGRLGIDQGVCVLCVLCARVQSLRRPVANTSIVVIVASILRTDCGVFEVLERRSVRRLLTQSSVSVEELSWSRLCWCRRVVIIVGVLQPDAELE